MLTYWRSVSTALLFAGLLLGQSNPVENFDLTGLPPKPTNYAEQRLVDMVERHQPGDVRDAVVIQQRLAEYYRQKGDAARARVADKRARSATQAAPPQGASPAVQSGAGTGPSVAGEYLCRSVGSRPCDTQTTISLHDDGTWGWRFFSGQYQVAGGRVTFKGEGVGAWGPAVIGPDTLTFGSGDRKGVWQKRSPIPPSVAGTYVCATAPGGCQTRLAIKIQSDGTWSRGSARGDYSIVGGQVKFSSLRGGPPGWGFAEFSHGALIFRNSRGSSEWRKQ